ncbi:MAG: cytochrome c [Acidobacteria bacterium]|nr:MAG: cytochrome c [Acidobacteriota bacterium]
MYSLKLSILVVCILFVSLFGLESLAYRSRQLASENQKDAAQLFKMHCAKCHGSDGKARNFRGKLLKARDLTDKKWQEKVSDQDITDAIKEGPGSMPSFENKLSEDQINSLVRYIRNLKQTDKDK